MGSDYVYSDTDSIKSLNTERHEDYFNSYNAQIMEKIEKSSQYHNIDKSLFAPYTKKGKQKIIGVWDDEGIYDKFKTLGAKRYLTLKGVQSTKPKYTITLAGSNKKKTEKFLVDSGNPFDKFTNGLTIPPESSGRLVLSYIDNETTGVIVDLFGESYEYHELSSIHMEKSEYNLSMSEEFIKYLEGISDFGE